MKTEEKKKEKCIHSGHRKRLVDLAINAGVDNLSDFQVLELFLTYIFPRGDVNPLAHRLLTEFDTFAKVVDSSVEDLMRVDGINERSAKMINLFGGLFFQYTIGKMGKRLKISNRADLVDTVEAHLRFRTSENLFLFALSSANIITHKRRFSSSSLVEVGVPTMELANFLASSKPSAMVIAHCHPFGKATPSEADKDAYKIVKEFCETCGVNLIDSLIVGDDGVFSQYENRMCRTYCDIDELKETISSFAK